MTGYTVGVDFGTLSARAVVASTENGTVLSRSVFAYPHGVMDRNLPDGTALQPGWALQNPQDYLDALYAVVPEAVRQAGVEARDVIGISLDFTASTLLPVDAALQPLCFRAEYRSRAHAWVKLWKHHAAQPQADRLNAIAAERGEPVLNRFGGCINAEMTIPKLLQMQQEDPELFDAAAYVLEAGDWITSLLTGTLIHSGNYAGFKNCWREDGGYPDAAFLDAVQPGFSRCYQKAAAERISPVGGCAGRLVPEQAEKLGLLPGTFVGVPVIDAHAPAPAVGVREDGDMLLILGTSTCDELFCRADKPVPGILSIVADGILPGFVCYEAGQSCVGDLFDWFVRNWVPADYTEEAEKRHVNIHTLLTEKADKLRPGESGLLALDWWNGNRSLLNDAALTGLIAGMTLATKPEEVYRALIEATAFGQRVILERLDECGIGAKRILACGGIAQKNPMLMQIYADVLRRPICVSSSDQAPALGSAIFAAAAAGKANGGYDSVFDAIDAMQADFSARYEPDAASSEIYEKLFRLYRRLHDAFGTADSLLKQLRNC